MYNLTWTQAQEAMREGKRVRNSNFTVAEWFTMQGCSIIDEAGYSMEGWYRGEPWQDVGWTVIADEIAELTKDVKFVLDFTNLEKYTLKSAMTTRTKDKPDCDYATTKIYKGKGHNKLQKRKKK